MCNINIDLLIKDRHWKREEDVNLNLMEDIFKIVFDYLKIPICRKNIEISITLTDDESIRVLNKDYRQKDKATNVLTFSLYEKKANILEDMEKLPLMSLGDVVFSYDTIQKEAEEQNKNFKNHFVHMLIHSYLHLFSYDHIKSKDRKEMEKLEIEILGKLGINNPYIID
ncbi:MAG: rRNA maturation RNase YbeY [Rickettsiales bacterium]|nr:rRNA maturation RNase YbeY [Rickettsiales bacterium]